MNKEKLIGAEEKPEMVADLPECLDGMFESSEDKVEELKKLLEFRTKFHNMIVHDLRTPSTSI